MATSGFSHEPRHSTLIEWYTPPHIFDALGLFFDLDPCSAGLNKDHVPARLRFTKDDDGLHRDWAQALVFCNPPYGSQTAEWLRKMSAHRNGIALVFARTGTKWWHETAPTTDVICFIAGRIRFINGNTGKVASAAGADSVLMAWGDTAKNAVIVSGLGICMSVTR